MNSSFNQVESSGHNGFGIGAPFPQFMYQMPSQMVTPPYPTIMNGLYGNLSSYVTPNMNQGQLYNGMNYPINVQPTMMFPMQYAYPTPFMSPNTPPQVPTSPIVYPYGMISTFQNGSGMMPMFFNMPPVFQEVQKMTPVSPYASSMSIEQNHHPLAGEIQFDVQLPREHLTPISATGFPIPKSRKRKSEDNEIVIPIKMLRNERLREPSTTEEFVLPPPLRDSDGRTGCTPGIMPMPPMAPGALFAGSMACNRHPDDISAMWSAARTRPLRRKPIIYVPPKSPQKETSPQVPFSFRKRNEYIYSPNLIRSMVPSGSIIEQSMTCDRMMPSTSRVLQEQNVFNRREPHNKGKMSPIRTPACFPSRNFVLPGPSYEHNRNGRGNAPEVISSDEQIIEYSDENSSEVGL